jgi:hypothetical protein
MFCEAQKMLPQLLVLVSLYFNYKMKEPLQARSGTAFARWETSKPVRRP